MTHEDEPDLRTDRQRQWARWAYFGYTKRYQPTQMLGVGGAIAIVLIAGLLTIFMFAFSRLP